MPRLKTSTPSEALFTSLKLDENLSSKGGKDSSAYQRIEDYILSLLSRGDLKKGDQLPSVRWMAETLNVNPNTVAKSYRDLQVRDLVTSRRGMGIYVTDKSPILKQAIREFRAEVIRRAETASSLLTEAGIEHTLTVQKSAA